MQRLQFALFQMDEAAHHLANGSIPALRVALLLLDNAVEVLLDRWVHHNLSLDALSERLQKRVQEMGVPHDDPNVAELMQQRFLNRDEKRRLSRYFDEKVRYATEVKRVLSPSVGSVLAHLHRYRNEAYHAGQVRPQTLRTSIMIQLELCCQLVVALGTSCSYGSHEDFSWLKKRFGLLPHDLWDERKRELLVSTLRDCLDLGGTAILETLAYNLEYRLTEVDEAINFISQESEIERSRVLCIAQEFALEEIKDQPPYRSAPKDLNCPLRLDDLLELEDYPERIRATGNAVEGFEAYAEADVVLERIEFVVSHLAGTIDEAIQSQIDAARGK